MEKKSIHIEASFDVTSDYPLNNNTKQLSNENEDDLSFTSNRLFDMRTYYLNKSNSMSLISGYELRSHSMDIFFHLEDRETGKYLKMDILTFEQLMRTIKHIFNVNIEYPDCMNNQNDNNIITVKEIYFKNYKITSHICNEYLIIDENSLSNLFLIDETVKVLINHLIWKKKYLQNEINVVLELCISNANVKNENDVRNVIMDTEFEHILIDLKFDIIVNFRNFISNILKLKKRKTLY